MKVYLAGPWAHREKAAEAALHLENAGHTITWPWWNFEAEGLGDKLCREHAFKDVMGVMSAQVVIVLQLCVSEGKAVEQGLALAGGKPVIVVNPDLVPANIFQTLPNFTIVATIEDAIAFLTAVQENLKAKERRIHVV